MQQSLRRSVFEDPQLYERHRGSSYHVDQTNTHRRISNQQAINLFKILDKYTKPTYKNGSKSSPHLNNENRLHHRRSKSTKHNNEYIGSNNQISMSRLNSQSSKIQLMLEKEIYNLKADLNRFKALEMEQNKKYQDKIFNMMQNNQRYPPPNIIFGDSQTPAVGMIQPFFAF